LYYNISSRKRGNIGNICNGCETIILGPEFVGYNVRKLGYIGEEDDS